MNNHQKRDRGSGYTVMELAEIKEWIVVLSASFTMITIAIGGWLSLRQYRLNLQAERRKQISSEIESEIRLQKHFTELMDIAHARQSYHISEKAVEFLLSDLARQDEALDRAKIRDRIVENIPIVTLPVGAAAQHAAIVAIATLSRRYPTSLREVGIQALQSLAVGMTADGKVSSIAENCLQQVLQNCHSNRTE